MEHRNTFHLGALALLLSSAPAWAQKQDTVMFNASYALQTDSNLFRLPSGTNDAERIGLTTAGISFNKAYSLQRVELDFNLVDYNYQNFSYLSYTAHNYSAAWRWSLTPKFYGSLSTDRQQVLNSFSDYQGYTQRNLRTNTNNGFDATYEVDGAWRLRAGMTRTSQTNEQTLSTGDDYSANSVNVGTRYAASDNGSVTYTVKASNGKYLNRALSATNTLDDEFSELGHEVRVYWVFSGKTNASMYASYTSRSHPHFDQRDFSGLNTGTTVNWDITGKTSLTASYTHALDSYQTSYASYTQTDRLSLGPAWQVRPKVYLGLTYDVARIDYLGAPTPVPTAQRKDTTHDTSLSIHWQPYQSINFSASLKRSQRDATLTNLPDLNYDSHIATLAAQATF
jgi:exopolysaccharide biosynthesis operon protein EpsL